ncbi:molybdate ABC transporter permease subunit [Paenibacillus illinoisensis]|uniref:molybdate ABC transporter permease subunit n=1 Tax=Paenibacillus illinoisensis TaxID=59845 RepID=UPI001C8D455A|nr:molybdate ABC transporter permease subunit [Paenibacillus illinoisensis]MBY0220198.1 molybdate ABC transporter permease subunit [Paenibacillus illinoisensis]MCM3207067.1 molybdate ABC transporter permease subunit [Paenibacillus illinoisensis]
MIVTEIDWSVFWSPVRLSLQVALLSSIIAGVLGIAVAWQMSRRSFRGKIVLETVFMLPLVLPPTVVGFLLLVLLGRKSLLGQWIEAIFSAPVIFSWWAAVIAAVVVAFPLIYQTMKSGFSGIDKDLEDAGRSIGANEWQVFRYISLPLAGRALMTAFILGFARALGEFGATLMIAGNIPGKTQTVPTAIYVAVDSGNQTMAWAWTVSIMIISFVMLLLTRQPNQEKA